MHILNSTLKYVYMKRLECNVSAQLEHSNKKFKVMLESELYIIVIENQSVQRYEHDIFDVDVMLH